MIGTASVEDQRSVPDSMYAHQQYNGISFPLVFFSLLFFCFSPLAFGGSAPSWAFSLYRVEFCYHLTARGTAVLDAHKLHHYSHRAYSSSQHKATTYLPT